MVAGKKSDELFDEDISSFEKEMESPEKLMADELLSGSGARPQAQMPKQRPAQQAQFAQPVQKIPAFVSLTKYKELRRSLNEMKNISSEMHRTLEGMKQNRDSGTELLDQTVKNLENMDDNIDKVKGVLRV